MKIEKNSDRTGFVLTNSEGASLNVSFMEFWDICRAGTEIDTKNEVEEFLAQCPDISGYDLDRIRAFPKLVDAITEQTIQDRINDESGDQIYYAAEKCIKSHIAEIEGKVKWFSLSEDKCISVWYSPDKYDGDQFQMHVEEKGEDGTMGPGCEIISSDSYATADISFKALCETLSEICDDADVLVDDESAHPNLVAKIAENIFNEFGMENDTKEMLEKEKPSLAEEKVKKIIQLYIDELEEQEVMHVDIAWILLDVFGRKDLERLGFGEFIEDCLDCVEKTKPGLDNIISDAETKKSEIEPRAKNKTIEHEI